MKKALLSFMLVGCVSCLRDVPQAGSLSGPNGGQLRGQVARTDVPRDDDAPGRVEPPLSTPEPAPVLEPRGPAIGDECFVYLKEPALLSGQLPEVVVDREATHLRGRLQVLDDEWLALRVHGADAVMWLPRSSVSAIMVPTKR